MLSRIAEQLFWIGRYLERADDTARILDVQLQVLVEDPSIDEAESCEQLLTVMGVEGYSGTVNRWTILDLLAHNLESPGSIASAIAATRESARGARETLSTDMWGSINTMWRGLATARSMRPPDMFAWVRNRSAMINGIAEGTMSRDEGWNFFVLGRSIERVDMTARLLSRAALASGSGSGTGTGGGAGPRAASGTGGGGGPWAAKGTGGGAGPRAASSAGGGGGPWAATGTAWPTTLRACGAYEAFVRAYRGLHGDRQAAEFLLLDRWFPRSVVSSLMEAERALSRLEARGQRAGFGDEAQRLLGRARTELEYRPLAEIVEEMPTEMERLQRTCGAASDAVSVRYFSRSELHAWTGGALL